MLFLASLPLRKPFLTLLAGPGQQKRKAETKLGKCEKQQNVLEGEVSQLEADMACIGSSDFERLNELASELETKRNKLSEIEEFWLLLSEEIEECSTKLEAMGRL